MSGYVAVIGRRGRFLVAEPLFERGPQAGIAGGVRVRGGEMVVVEPHARGVRVLEVLGAPDRAGDVVGALMLDRGLERGFDESLAEAAERAALEAAESELARRDLRDLPTFTVDPASARDFDDAVSAAPEGDGTRLWIHIADVAAHVRPDSPLDREALRRGNSTYVPGTVEPMLPLALSAVACSLAAGVDRLAVTAEIVVSAKGEARSRSRPRSPSSSSTPTARSSPRTRSPRPRPTA